MTELHQASVATGSESTCGLSIDQSLAENLKPERSGLRVFCAPIAKLRLAHSI